MLMGTWNINSINIRKEQVLKLLEQFPIDLLALQETKVNTENFPVIFFEKSSYYVYHSGGKGRNGVALISKEKAKEIKVGFEGLKDTEAFPDAKERILGINLFNEVLKELWIFSVYIPNGGSVNSDYYFYKLQFLWKLRELLELYLSKNISLVIMGDFNVAPEDKDVYDPEILKETICCTEKERKAFKALLELGLVDILRLKHPEDKVFTWWDYQFFSFKRNLGMRLDHILVSNNLIDKIEDVWVEKGVRAWKKPSDHAPVLVRFNP